MITRSNRPLTTILFILAAAVMIALASGSPASAQFTCGFCDGSNTAAGENALTSNTTGVNNTATGTNALVNNTTGFNNTATGWEALTLNTTGVENTATGQFALEANTTGNQNTADGKAALFGNTGSSNTGTGYKTLFSNAGNANTAAGWEALFSNTSASNNTGIGFQALFANTTGTQNTANGVAALFKNSTGSFNTANGLGALESNTTGSNNTAAGINTLLFATASNNTAIGANGLQRTTIGANNTALGFNALISTTTGNNNIGLGSTAGSRLTTGSNNIEIGNAGVAADSKTIRIGVQGTQISTFIAGIRGTPVTGGVDVTVSSTGQLGVAPSSARYKRDIQDMDEASSRLMKLRPVTFHYKSDPQGITEYGLVAEEVERVYPELVAYGTDGKVETVRYSMLIPMLLNELQKQSSENVRQAEQLKKLSEQMARANADHELELRVFQKRLATLEQAMRTGNGYRRVADASPAFPAEPDPR